MKLPIQQKKYQCSVSYYESDKAANVRRHAETIHALPNPKQFNTNNTPDIHPTNKVLNFNDNEGNVYPDEENLGKHASSLHVSGHVHV